MERLTFEEFKARFGSGTERRVELWEQFQGWLSAAQATGALRRLWVFGSFASDKPGPGDIDLFAQFASDFEPAELPPDARHWFDHQLCHDLHEMDLFFMREDVSPAAFTFLLEGFRYDREGRESMVEVLL